MDDFDNIGRKGMHLIVQRWRHQAIARGLLSWKIEFAMAGRFGALQEQAKAIGLFVETNENYCDRVLVKIRTPRSET